MYFSGQGKVFVAPLVAGVISGVYRWIGNVPNFSPAFATEKLEHKESYTGQRLNDLSLTTANNSTFSATLEDWSPENLALAVRGNIAKTQTGNVTGEVVIPADTTLAAGMIGVLKNPGVTTLVLTDSTGTPKTLVKGTDYEEDLGYGTFTLKGALTGFVTPIKASYAKSALTVVPFFTAGVQEVAIRFEGVNTADGNKKVLAELYRVALDPTAELGLITEELGSFSLEGNCLIDNTKTDDVLFGKFGRVIYVP